MFTRFARDHRWTPRHLSAYLDGDLAVRARARLDRHVAECPECRGALHSLHRMLVRLERQPAPDGQPEPRALADAVRARIAAEVDGPSGSAPSPPP